ncbi:MAG: HlyD family efflux transporter periplasmic adaptor subunit [Pseudomonadota bacterium]
MSRQLFYSIAILAVGTLLAAFLIWLRPDPVEVERVEQVPLVETVPLKEASGAIPVLASGTVQAREEVSVAAEISGRLTYVNPNFREGGAVAKGVTLFRIEQSDYLNQVRVAEADVAAQSVAVLEAEEEVDIAREELSRFAARAKAGQSAGVNESRILPPRGMETATQSDVPKREGAASRGLATREPQLASAKAARDRAEANLSDAKLRLGRTRVRAPFSGLVREESAAVGQLVQPGERLGSLVATDAYEVRVSLTADEAALLPGLLTPSSGRIAASVANDYGGKTYRYPAFVDRANAILDAATRNIEVYVRVPSPLSGGRPVNASDEGRAPPMLLGAFVNVEIIGASLDSYAAIPAQAVRPGNEIWVVRDGKLAILKVRVIQRSDETAYITAPSLSQGGLLVTSALTAAIEGMPLRTAAAKGAPGE